MHVQRAVDEDRDLMMSFPTAVSVVRRLRTPNKMEIRPRPRFVKERLEGRIDDVERRAAAVRHSAHGECGPQKDVVERNPGETAHVGKLALRVIVRRSGTYRSGVKERAVNV